MTSEQRTTLEPPRTSARGDPELIAALLGLGRIFLRIAERMAREDGDEHPPRGDA